MKIGILTQPLTSNYGGILQNYALQQALLRMGYNPLTIDIGKYTWLDWMKDVLKHAAKVALREKFLLPRTPISLNIENKPLRRFVERNICLSDRIKKPELKIITKNQINAIIVGSDQVWRPKYNWALLPDMFLEFAELLPIIKIAYAVSFGTDDWEFSQSQTMLCSSLVKHFAAVSVREESGVQLCKQYLGIEAVHVLDPTLLLNKEDYIKLCGQIPSRAPFVFAYILDVTEVKKNEIVRFANQKGLSYVIKSAGEKISKNDSVENWLSLFRDAQFIITDSFHGTVFSIIYNKEFWVYTNHKRGNSRFQSLLDIFGLKDRLIDEKSIPDMNPIEWEKVNQIKEEKRNFALSFLRDNLNPLNIV